MSVTTGAFLQEKFGNMQRWLGTELKTPLMEGYPTDIECTYVAEKLHDKRDAIAERDWDIIYNELPGALTTTVDEIRSRGDLHDKFWRYLSLFSDTIAAATGS